MWPFKKKEKEKEPGEGSEEGASEALAEGKGEAAAANASVSGQISTIQVDLTKIKATLESLKEMRTSTSERFSTINEQIGELRGQIMDTNRTLGLLEVKATKAADLVESVHPDKLMIQLQKEDGKIEGLRGMLEAKEEMIKNVMDQLKKIRDQMGVFRGIEQVIKLNEEVKDEIMEAKKISAMVERHADRVENVFAESQKSFKAFSAFSDKLENLKSDIKDLSAKTDKVEVAVGTFMKKKDVEDRLEKIEKFDKKVKDVLDEVESYYKKLDSKFKETEGKLRGEFEFKIEKAEIMSKAFEDLLRENPILAEGLNLGQYLHKHLSEESAINVTGTENEGEKTGVEAGAVGVQGPKPAVEEGKKIEQPAQKQAVAAPDKKLVQGMTPVKK